MTAVRPSRRVAHPLLWAALGVMVIAGGWFGWRSVRRSGASFDPGVVGAFLDTRLAGLSDSVYRVQMGQVHLDLRRAAMRIDSVVITTDTVRNRWLMHPYPIIRIVCLEAEIRGLARGAEGRGWVVDEIRFGQVVASMTLASGDGRDRGTRSAADSSPEIVSWTAPIPDVRDQVVVRRVLLEGVSATLHPAPGSPGRDQYLDHLRVILDSVRADPRPGSVHFPILVHDIRVLLSDFAGGWDSASTVSVGALEGSFRDSTLMIRGLALRPTRSIREVLDRSGWRHDRFTVDVDSLRARGVNWRTALRDGAVPVRDLRLDGPDFLIYSDHRLPSRRYVGSPKPILQETLRKFGRPIAVDSVEIHRGRVRYQNRTVEGDGIGEVTFEQVSGTMTGLYWRPDTATGATVVLSLHAQVWGLGPLALTIQGPVDAKSAEAELHLFVGAMPLDAANQYASHVAPYDIRNGELDSLRVRAMIYRGRATGEVRPYYHGLSVRARGPGGFFKRLGRGAKMVIANSFVILGDNPTNKGVMAVGRIDLVREPGQTFWPFAWVAIREGLLPIVLGHGMVEE